MSKTISGNAIIGNYIVECLRDNRKEFSIVELFEFDEKVSEKLEGFKIFSNFSNTSVEKFLEEDHPYMFEKAEEGFITLKDDLDWKNLARRFRLGIPHEVGKIMSKVYEEMK